MDAVINSDLRATSVLPSRKTLHLDSGYKVGGLQSRATSGLRRGTPSRKVPGRFTLTWAI